MPSGRKLWHRCNSWQGKEIFLSSKAPRPVFRSTQPCIHQVSEAPSIRKKWLEQEVNQSTPSTVARIKTAQSYGFNPSFSFTAWCLIQHRNKSTNFFFSHPLSWIVSCSPSHPSSDFQKLNHVWLLQRRILIARYSSCTWQWNCS